MANYDGIKDSDTYVWKKEVLDDVQINVEAPDDLIFDTSHISLGELGIQSNKDKPESILLALEETSIWIWKK